jgi:hypothetical protein
LKDRAHGDETTGESTPWHDWYREYESRWTAKMQPVLDRFPDRADVIREHLKPTLVPLPVAVDRLQAASEVDVQWLVGALRDEPTEVVRRRYYGARHIPTRRSL